MEPAAAPRDKRSHARRRPFPPQRSPPGRAAGAVAQLQAARLTGQASPEPAEPAEAPGKWGLAWPDPATTRLFAGLIGLSLGDGLSLTITPLVNGAWSEELRLTAGQIGTLLTLQFLAGALSSIALATRLHRIAPRRAGIAFGLAAAGLSAALAFASGFTVLAVGEVAFGLAAGGVSACAAAAIAGAHRVDRTSALVSVVVTLLVAACTLPISALAAHAGRRGLFLSQAGVLLFAVALVAVLSRQDTRRIRDLPPPFGRAIASPVVIAQVALGVGSTAVWAFTERIGAGLGMNAGAVGAVLAAASVVGIAGGVGAAVVARPGRERVWAIAGVAAFGVANAVLALAPNRTAFMAAMAVQAFFYVFSNPFLTAIAIVRDGTGGLAAAAGGWSSLVSALAPALAGWLVARGGFAPLAWQGLAFTAVAVVALTMMRPPPAPA